MLKIIKSLAPKPLKRAVRRSLLEPLRARAGERLLRRCVREFRSWRAADRALVERFRRAWGNESFSADVTYVSEVIARAGACEAPVLECGSGLTTLVAALAAERRGVTVWSLEQDAGWLGFVGRRLAGNGVRNVRLLYAPLKAYGDYVWYDLDGVELPDSFGLVLCDGPAVFEGWGEAHAQWRYGVLPVLAARGVRVGEILLDDATEPRAASLLDRWRREFGMGHRLIETDDGDCAVVTRAG